MKVERDPVLSEVAADLTEAPEEDSEVVDFVEWWGVVHYLVDPIEVDIVIPVAQEPEVFLEVSFDYQ